MSTFPFPGQQPPTAPNLSQWQQFRQAWMQQHPPGGALQQGGFGQAGFHPPFAPFMPNRVPHPAFQSGGALQPPAFTPPQNPLDPNAPGAGADPGAVIPVSGLPAGALAASIAPPGLPPALPSALPSAPAPVGGFPGQPGPSTYTL